MIRYTSFCMKTEKKNKKCLEEIFNYIENCIIRETYMSSISMIKLEKYAEDILRKNFKELFEEYRILNWKEHIAVCSMFNITNGDYGIYPGNLFTALLMNNKYRADATPEEINESNKYYICENGKYAMYVPELMGVCYKSIQ